METFAQVMTRVFGWGLPETMLVPFADFFNHHCSGINHYVLNKDFEENKGEDCEEYVLKRK